MQNPLIERLYIHIPFCEKICSFCNLYARQDKGAITQLAYLNNLQEEILKNKHRLSPLKSLYIGGGTPSQLTLVNLQQFLTIIDNNLNFANNYEFSFEAHPNTLSENKIALIANSSINRLSIGVESFNKYTTLERYTSTQQLDIIFNLIDKNNIKNVNLDLIYNVPQQTLQQWQYNLIEILKYPTKHLATYSLILENSILSNQYDSSSLDDNLAVQMWQTTIEILNKHGYKQYEFSNYAQEDYHCQHNLATWQGENFLGIGSGASSIINNTHKINSKSLDWLNKEVEINKLTPYQRACEIVAFNFRHTAGISQERLKNINGINMLEQFKTTFENLIQIGWIKKNKTTYFVTENGLLFADTIANYFID